MPSTALARGRPRTPWLTHEDDSSTRTTSPRALGARDRLGGRRHLHLDGRSRSSTRTRGSGRSAPALRLDLFRNTTTNGGDMGAHVWWPWFLERQLVPEVPALGLGARLVRRLPGRAVLLPVPGVDDRGAQPRDAVQRRVQARDGERPAHAPGRARTTSPRACGRRGPAPPAFAIAAFGMLVQDAHRLEDLRRQHREHARGRVLVRDRARVRAVRARRARVHARHREAAVAAGGAASRRDHVAHRRRDLRRDRGDRCSGSCAARGAPGRSRSPVGAVGVAAHRGVVAAAARGNRRTRRACGTRRCSPTGSSFKLPYWIFLPDR